MRYLKTIGLRTLVPVGRGFTFPYDTAFSSDGRMFVLNRERVTTPLGTRIQICTFEEEFLGEFGNGKGTGDDQFMVPVAMAFDSNGSLIDRVNFAVDHMGDLSNPGVRDIVDRVVRECGEAPAAEELVDASLDMVGPLQVSDDTRSSLVELASREGRIDLGRYPDDERAGRLMEDLLRSIVSSREYQLV